MSVRRHEATRAETRTGRRIGTGRGAALHALLDDAEAIGELRAEDCDLEHVSKLHPPRAPALMCINPRRRVWVAHAL
jgi:hypothetical protein